MRDTKGFTTREKWLHRRRNRFGLNNTEITEKAVSAHGDAAIFLAELRKLTTVQTFTGSLGTYHLRIRGTTVPYNSLMYSSMAPGVFTELCNPVPFSYHLPTLSPLPAAPDNH